MVKIGVFDSGVGGQSVATAISLALPNDDIIFVNDNKNVPYGTKSEEQLYKLSLPFLQKLALDGCQVIVIACNSVSTTIIDKLRQAIDVPLIGVEPMLEEACHLTKSNVIAVCATPRTLTSNRYKELCAQYAKKVVLLEPDCSEWMLMIERNLIDKNRIELVITDALDQDADVVVLGCTHFHWIESTIKSIVKDRAIVLQPEQQIVKWVKQELEQLA